MGLDAGAGPGRGAALAAAGAWGEHRQRARLPVPRPGRGAAPDRCLARPGRAGPAGAGDHRLPRRREVRGAGAGRHHRRCPIRAVLPPGDHAVRASVGSVGCAVHAKAKTALEVAEEIAPAASARLPKDTGDLVPAIRETLDEHGGRRLNVIIDALDEAASQEKKREIIDQVALPLVETCSDAGAQVVIGTRRRDDGGNLLGRFGGALEAIDLDDPRYFAEEDLTAYALACLQLAGDERPGNPYA